MSHFPALFMGLLNKPGVEAGDVVVAIGPGPLGLFGKPIEIDFEQIAYKELQVTGFFTQKWTAWEKSAKASWTGKNTDKATGNREAPHDRMEEMF